MRLSCLLPPRGLNPGRCPTAGPATRFNSREGRFLLVRLIAPPLQDTYIRIFLKGATEVLGENDDNGGTFQSLLTWSPDADGTYVVEVARYSRDPIQFDGNLLYSQPSACDDFETTTLSINAECSAQTVEYGSGAIRQWSQELRASQTYTWSTVGQTLEVGPRGAVV